MGVDGTNGDFLGVNENSAYCKATRKLEMTLMNARYAHMSEFVMLYRVTVQWHSHVALSVG